MNEPSPQLAAYLDRIGWTAPVAPDLATLAKLQRAHVEAIPFENLDVQLGRPPTRDPDAIFAKLVTARRGGWCYEMNGLFGRMLREIGFTVTPIAAGVMRQLSGAATMGSHLCLLVRLERDYLVDVGFGGALAAPLPLTEGGCEHAPKACVLRRTEDGYWRYAERSLAGGEPFGFDFRTEPADEALLDRQCRWQGENQSSVFVQNLVVQRRDGERHLSLRGRILTELAVDGESKRLVVDAGDIVSTLRERFDLDVPDAAMLWPKIAARHDEVMAAQPPVLPTT